MRGHRYPAWALLMVLAACRDGSGGEVRAREDRQEMPPLDQLDEADRQAVMAGVRTELGAIAREAKPYCDALFGPEQVGRIAGVAVRPAEFFPARLDQDTGALHCQLERGPAGEDAMPLILTVDCGPERGDRPQARAAAVLDAPACYVRATALGMSPEVEAALLRHAVTALRQRPALAPPAPR